LSALTDNGISKKLRKNLRPVFETDVTRLAIPVSEESVEMAIDRGAIHANGTDVALCEVELELKKATRITFLRSQGSSWKKRP
jgi:inorganic triphosphatase YgiF